MACYLAHYHSLSLSPHRIFNSCNRNSRNFNMPLNRFRVFKNSAIADGAVSFNTLVSEVVRLLVPPANFDSSKLNVIFMRESPENHSGVMLPRTYILSHCDLTANLTLSVSSVINLDQLEGWYQKDDVVAEWKKVKDEMRLHVHCCVSGPNLLQDIAAEFRYHIFSKELPLVLKALLYGDSLLFSENPELMDAYVWVYFHSRSPKFNRIECWGPLKDAAKGKQKGLLEGFLTLNKQSSSLPRKWTRPKSIFQALFAFLLCFTMCNSFVFGTFIQFK